MFASTLKESCHSFDESIHFKSLHLGPFLPSNHTHANYVYSHKKLYMHSDVLYDLIKMSYLIQPFLIFPCSLQHLQSFSLLISSSPDKIMLGLCLNHFRVSVKSLRQHKIGVAQKLGMKMKYGEGMSSCVRSQVSICNATGVCTLKQREGLRKILDKKEKKVRSDRDQDNSS